MVISRRPTLGGLGFFIRRYPNTLSIVHWHRGGTGDKTGQQQRVKNHVQTTNVALKVSAALHQEILPYLCSLRATLEHVWGYLANVAWSQRSWWVCQSSGCRETEHGGGRKARRSSLGKSFSARSRPRGSIARRKTGGDSGFSALLTCMRKMESNSNASSSASKQRIFWGGGGRANSNTRFKFKRRIEF